jgi:superfamily I DNA and/or RNA helicase/very-short-patch-repair endonuclease
VTQNNSTSKELNKKAISLYQYLQNLVRLRTSIVTDLNSYKDKIWLYEIPRHRLTNCAVWDLEKEEYDIWLEIKRPVFPKVPFVSKECQEWVDLNTLGNYDQEPVLKEKIVKQPEELSSGDECSYIELVNYPEIVEIWNDYLETKWKPWAEECRELKKVHNIYTRLFSIYQQQKALGEAYEVVMALGLLNFQTKKGLVINRHILSAQIELVFEPNRGTLVVKANPEGANLQFETEMLDFDDQPQVEIIRNLEIEGKNIGNDIWDKTKIHSLIKSWTNSFNPNAQYHESFEAAEGANSKDWPEVFFMPALILRERTQVGILKFIGSIIEQLQDSENEALPPPVHSLLATEEKRNLKSNLISNVEEEQQSFKLPSQVYFPLFYNEEQLRIAEDIERCNGVVVQGPPGTGKSHTIANLICHLLASGKRILVTSQTPRALKVLKDKIPVQVQSLCVSVLGRSQKDLDSLIGSVQEITGKNNTWDFEKSKERISKLEKKLDEYKQELQSVKVSLTELREKETLKHSIIEGKFTGTAQDISTTLSHEEAQYESIQDEIDSEDACPLSNSDFMLLFELYRKFHNERRHELQLKRIPISTVFTPEEFVEVVEQEKDFKQNAKLLENNIHIRAIYEKLKKCEQNKRQELLNVLRQLDKAKADACRRPIKWLKDCVFAILGDQDQLLKLLASATKSYLSGLKEAAELADKNNFSLPKDLDLQKIKADAEDLKKHLDSGKGLGWWIVRPKIYSKTKYLLTSILVNGRYCDNADCLGALINYIGVETNLQKLNDIWKDKIDIIQGSAVARVAIYLEQLEALDVVLSLESPLHKAKQIVSEIDVIAEPSWHNEAEITNLIKALEGTFIVDKLIAIEQKIDKIKVALKALIPHPDSHALNKDLLEAIDTRDWNRWSRTYEILNTLENDYSQLGVCVDLIKRLKAKAPLLADSIHNNPYDNKFDKYAAEFEKAWDWLRADAWLREFEKSHNEYQLQYDYEDIDKKLRRTMAELASEKAWNNCLSSLTETQRQNLVAWSHAIRKIGKGTGKHAEKYRREAAGYMEECRGAIPAWIMPLYRVVESIKPAKEIFDVVIVDEASQSGPEAIALFYIAKKCIIVGDDQQISPEDVGLDPKEVDLLIERFLKDIPLRQTYGLQSSLFTHAKIRYKAQTFLREHFRCVPEIIQFSNNLCYVPLGASLIPLRSAPPQRLEPVKAVYVKDGYKEGDGQSVINKVEAARIVDQIVKCCNDRLYKGKSMGVIVLQGHAQDQLIKSMLIDRIGAEEIERRNLICGDPYAFQGDERDVMFLSLVAAPNDRIGALAKETDKRRFNVAFSRARDQIWLFYSATLNDLSPSDYRHILLSYCLNPLAAPMVLGDFDLEELRKASSYSHKNRSNVPDPFESWFEVDVFLRLIKHKYRVIPQFKVAEHRIDLVVEGTTKRLAIECDGDEWHGPEQYEHDQWRQRILERAGWRFWRIRGSAFYRDPEEALEPLWQVLDEMGIFSSDRKIELEKLVIEESKTVEIVQAQLIPESVEQLEEREPIETNEEDRLFAALSYAKEREGLIYGAKRKEIFDAINKLLKEGSQGKDLIADRVLRDLEYTCRGRNREKLRKRVMRVITDMKRRGMIEEYETNKRIRIHLSTKRNDLFT